MKSNIKWGLILGIAVVAGTQILTWAGLGLSNWFVGLTYILVVLIVGLGLRELKIIRDGKLKFPAAALAVVIIILISRIIFQLYMFIYTQYIDPEWVNAVADTWTDSMTNANISVDIIAKRIAGFRKSYEPLSMFTIQIINFGLPQIVLGLIVSIFFISRKKKQAASF